MGLLDRETQRVGEMYFLLLLLLSPASGMPRSAQQGVEEEIVNELGNVFNFTTETGNLLKNPKLFEKVSDRLKEAENAFLEMEIELKTMESEDHILLQITILRMRDLMIETLESLEVARKEYKSALITFENLISSVKVQNG